MDVLIAMLCVLGTAGILGATSWMLYRSSRDAGASLGSAASLSLASAVLLGGWALLSAWIAHRGGYETLLGKQPPWLPIAAGGELIALLLLTRLPAVSRSLSGPRTVRLLAVPHGARVAGLAFLLSMAAGHLPVLFALPAGLGDVIVGITEPWVWRRWATNPHRGRALAFTWFGIGDLVVAMALGGLTAYDIVHVSPESTVSQLPLALIPTAAVPVLFALHILSLRRLGRSVALARLATA